MYYVHITEVHQKSITLYLYVCVQSVCTYICMYMVCICVRSHMCIYVCVWVSMYVHLCMCIYVCVCVFACGWIYGVGVVQPKTRYLTWRLQYRLQLMVKETLMFQRAKIEIIEVSVMLPKIVAWHELQ